MILKRVYSDTLAREAYHNLANMQNTTKALLVTTEAPQASAIPKPARLSDKPAAAWVTTLQ